jgi:hypothetical protein
MEKGKKIAILQSNYIPWKGYFDIINFVDEFVLFDDAQYTKNDWRNRNQIKTQNGLLWLTIPIKRNFKQPIKDALVVDQKWRKKHWRSISESYARAPHFKFYKDQFEELYIESQEIYLSKINYKFLNMICGILGIETKITWSMDYSLPPGKTERLISVCQQAGAGEYISGPAAKDYIEEKLFNEAGIKITFMDYSGYPEYSQLFHPFDHSVSIIDLLFNEGPNASNYMKSFDN